MSYFLSSKNTAFLR